MASENGASFAGKRLAELRSSRRLTAQELADLTPGDVVTKTVITNLESGRKRDMTLSEAVALAWALGVSVLDFTVDRYAPWARVPFADLAGEFHELENIEYARRASIYASVIPSRDQMGGIDGEVIDLLVRAECFMALRAELDYLIGLDDGTSVWLATPYGDTISSGQVLEDNAWEVINQPIIDFYRQVMTWTLKRGWSNRERFLKSAYGKRLERVRECVVELIEEDPELDYGQNSARRNLQEVILDPLTGYPVVRPYGGRSDASATPTD